MDITVYDKLYEALEKALVDFNAKTGYNAALSPFEPQNPEYPLIIMYEVRNQPKTVLYSPREEISSMGYRVDIFAKTKLITPPDGEKKSVDKQTICRVIMDFITNFMQKGIGLRLISNNPFPNVGTQGELYEIVLVFQRDHFDNREIFI